MPERKLTKRDYLVISSMLFALFFGAGNLIFPIHLGQLAGNQWLPAVLGFLTTAVFLPLLSVLAISVTHSDGVYDIGRPVGAKFALIFMVLIQATIGPLFGTPRTATVSYTVGIAPLIPARYQAMGLLIFTALFFGTAFFFARKQNKIISSVGKILNPLFLILLFVVFFIAFMNPMGDPATVKATADYTSGAFINGFLQGYNTMDALGGLAFGVTIVTTIKMLGKTKDSEIALITARSGVIAMGAEAVIYVALVLIGAMSLGTFKLSADGGVAFSQMVTHYSGVAGQALLATLIVLTCLTTAIGLLAAFAQDFHKHFPKVSYPTWLLVTSVLSFLFANLGLTKIIAWSLPILMLLYPIAMVLIVLAVTSPLFKNVRIVYQVAITLTIIPAVLDMISAFPAVISQSGFGGWVTKLRMTYLPLAAVGLDWVPFAVVGVACGLLIYLYQRRKK
ncbi:branched-chain amino acid transport system II carrier protein [Lapidilactobacillus mulanensis]|uniref:Branched-chain amino acid transport system carrier protein n=1 Tax=Lapidilactobacillus mulanensis TaxID=2485999 RepID=A0ABW4DLA9_9LACO|nr:branched-chain amino acid transport system II carrier protein [Lapidilactobacillus mulanensis]